MSKTKKEILVGKSKIFIDDDGIIHDIAEGSSNKEIATQIKETILSLAENRNGKSHVICDLTNAGIPTYEARKIYAGIANEKKIGKVAMIGSNTISRIIAAFTLKIMRNTNTRFFKSKEAAIKWLKENGRNERPS
jgi:hypothetical protein